MGRNGQSRAEPRRVAIVGAGPGGLAAAMLLAATGVRVTVFERLPAVGGRTRVVEAEGFRFDVGPACSTRSWSRGPSGRRSPWVSWRFAPTPITSG